MSVGESVNIQKTSAEGDQLSVSPSVSEAVHQSGTATMQQSVSVTAAALQPQLVPSTSSETKGIWICRSGCVSFYVFF